MTEESNQQQPTDSSVFQHNITDEMKDSFLSYSMSVIVSRALPDVRDGLKPVHRRILYAMNKLNITSQSKFVKSARVVGEVIGKYHPHGDSAVYDAMVRMAQDFSLRFPLVDGQGNFGSIDGDSAAAYRYTEARITKLSEEMLQDLEKETVPFTPNFDDSLTEPSVLPAKAPNLLLNGSSGIAVGMATNMPPHNLREVGEAIIALIQNPELEIVDLAQIVSGPDFPTGGIIYGHYGIKSAYATGYGKVIVRSKTHIEEVGSRQAIIIDEVPYQVNKAMLIEQIAVLVKDKIIEGIHDIRDESDRDGIRVVIELKKDAQTEIVLNSLFKHSRMQVTFGIINLCLVEGIPRVLNLKELCQQFISHRFVIITKRTEFDLRKEEKRAHILRGLAIAIKDIDTSIQLIKSSKTAAEAKESLMSHLSIDDVQAQAILEMRLQRLTGLEREKILSELEDVLARIASLKELLASDELKYQVIVDETKALIEQFGNDRKTQIVEAEIDMDIEDMIPDEMCVVTQTQSGYVKRVSLDEYRAQKRGGKGVIGTTTKEEDVVVKVFVAHSKSQILYFTNSGQVHWLKVWKIPQGSRTSKGRNIVNLLSLAQDERVTASVPIKTFDESMSLLLCTKRGTVKKSSLLAYARPRAGGIRAIKLIDDDELISAEVTDGNKEVIIATKLGLAARFHENDAREMGRVSQGVRGIRLQDGDEVIGMVTCVENDTLLTITENGFGKRTKVSEYRKINRGGKGVINIQTSDRNGIVVSVKVVEDETGLILMSRKGIIIRTRADQISVIGRNTQGVRIMRIEENDVVVSCAKIVIEDEE